MRSALAWMSLQVPQRTLVGGQGVFVCIVASQLGLAWRLRRFCLLFVSSFWCSCSCECPKEKTGPAEKLPQGPMPVRLAIRRKGPRNAKQQSLQECGLDRRRPRDGRRLGQRLGVSR